MTTRNLFCASALALSGLLMPEAQALAGPCYSTDLNFISQDDFFWKGEFLRLGILRPDRKVGELVRYTCYDLSAFQGLGSLKFVVNPFVDDIGGDLAERPNYIGLQVITIRPTRIGRSTIEFHRAKNSRAHAGQWAIPKGAWKSAADAQYVTTSQDIEFPNRDIPYSHSYDLPDQPASIGENPEHHLPEVVNKFQAADSPEKFSALAGRWHAWVVAPAPPEKERNRYYIYADTWADSKEWKLNATELDRLVAGHRVTIRNYLHLITPMQLPQNEDTRHQFIGADNSKLYRRRIVFDVPIADAACLYVRPVSSRDLIHRFPIAPVGGERFVAFQRISNFNCPGPDEYRNLFTYFLYDAILGYR